MTLPTSKNAASPLPLIVPPFSGACSLHAQHNSLTVVLCIHVFHHFRLLLQKMTHRGLPGDDPTDCSFVFLYMLCSISIRPNLQKILGFAPPRATAGQTPFG